MTKVFLYISVGLFIFSLTQPCYCTTESCGDSIAALISGTMGFVFGGAALTWLANPLLITSWIVVNRNRRLSFLTSTLAFVLSLSFLFFEEVISDEAGHYSKIISYESGYWLWLSSTVVMAMGNMLMTIIERKNR